MHHKRIRAFACGRVQGVGFRFFTQRVAVDLGIRGFVRNLDDGRVEVVACGTAAAIDMLMVRVEQGPPGSAVTAFSLRQATDVTEEFTTFSIRR